MLWDLGGCLQDLHQIGMLHVILQGQNSPFMFQTVGSCQCTAYQIKVARQRNAQKTLESCDATKNDKKQLVICGRFTHDIGA